MTKKAFERVFILFLENKSEQALLEDVKNDALPGYSWFTPDIQHDGHTPLDEL